MSLDDLIGDPQKNAKSFLARNNNDVCFYLGIAIGAIEGMSSPYQPNIAATIVDSIFWFGLVWPGVFSMVYSSRLGIPVKKAAEFFYLTQGPENTAAFATSRIVTSTVLYAVKRGLLG